jgi:hypothetical protein
LLGHGDFEFDDIIVALNDVGYNGPLSVEWEASTWIVSTEVRNEIETTANLLNLRLQYISWRTFFKIWVKRAKWILKLRNNWHGYWFSIFLIKETGLQLLFVKRKKAVGGQPFLISCIKIPRFQESWGKE